MNLDIGNFLPRKILCYAFLVSAALLVLQSKSMAAGTGNLTTNKSEVKIIFSPNNINSQLIWNDSETIAIRNNSSGEIALDSFSMRPDYGPGSERLKFFFAQKTGKGQFVSTQEFTQFKNPNTSKIKLNNAMKIPPHDSILLGQFVISQTYYVTKTSAQSKIYNPGDSINTEVTFFSGNDSTKIQLSGKEMLAVAYYEVGIKNQKHKRSPLKIFTTYRNGFQLNGAIIQSKLL